MTVPSYMYFDRQQKMVLICYAVDCYIFIVQNCRDDLQFGCQVIHNAEMLFFRFYKCSQNSCFWSTISCTKVWANDKNAGSCDILGFWNINMCVYLWWNFSIYSVCAALFKLNLQKMIFTFIYWRSWIKFAHNICLQNKQNSSSMRIHISKLWYKG